MKIAVIGAGASGIMAALMAARSQNHEIVLFERNERVGRKLLVTGSGRCNVTNSGVSAERYACDDKAWMKRFLDLWGVGELEEVLRKLGLPLKATDDGWYYPLSESAHAVVSILEHRLRLAGVKLRVATTVKEIKAQANGEEKFEVAWQSADGLFRERFDRVALAAGGKAYPDLGSKGELFDALGALGHQIRPLIPALGPVYVKLGDFAALKGQRFDARVAIYSQERCLGQAEGNVIVTERGFNGPGVMDLSHLVGLHAKEALTLAVTFPFLQSKTFHELAGLTGQNLGSLLAGWLPPKIAERLIRRAGFSLAEPPGQESLKHLIAQSNLVFPITGTGDFSRSQVTVGGVPVGEVSAETFESRLAPGLYLVGETLDAAGPCGGFNLHFAFGSGYLAGAHLARSNQPY